MKEVKVKEFCFGGSSFGICAAIAPKDAAGLAADLTKAADSRIAAVEIKLNSYAKPENFAEDLKANAAVLEKMPVILTVEETGTDNKIAVETAEAVIKACAENHTADIISVEAMNAALTAYVKDLAASAGVKLMLTYQGYEGLDGPKEIVAKTKELCAQEPDMVRVMYLAKDDVDVIHLARAAKQLKSNGLVNIPLCISAIGDVGLMLRLYAERVGNDFGFCRLYGDEEGNYFENLDEYYTLRELYDVENPKLQSPIKYDMNGIAFGGDKYLNCMMIKEGSRAGILEKAYDVLKYHPDIVEWRLDYMNPMINRDFAEEMLVETAKQLAAVLAPIPIIMTFRIKEQGGFKKYPDDLRKRMVKACVRTGLIAVADVEIDSDDEYIKEIKAECEKYGTKLLLSFHDWDKVPTDDFMFREFEIAVERGADIPKMYVTANSYQDVIRIARTARALRKENRCEKPFCLCGMNDIAMITRILGSQCGSELGYFTWADVRGGYEEDAIYFEDLLELFDLKKNGGYA